MYERLADFLAYELPESSFLRSGEPPYLLAALLLLSIPSTLIFLHLAWRSINTQVPFRQSILPAVGLSCLLMLCRQLIPVPYHILPFMIPAVLVLRGVGRVRFVEALVAAIFAESVFHVSSTLLVEPFLIFIEGEAFLAHLRSPLGITIGSFAEALIPFVLFLIFRRYQIALIHRPRRTPAG